MRIGQTIFFLMLIFSISCKTKTDKFVSSDELKSIIEKVEKHTAYDSEKYPLGLYTRSYYKEEAVFAKEKMELLDQLDVSELGEDELISVALLKFKLQNAVDVYEYESFLNPLLSDSGFHNNLSFIVKKFVTQKQIETYINKLKAIPTFVDQHIDLLREGIEKKITQPKVIFKGFELSYDAHIVENAEESIFYKGVENLPDTFTETQKDSIKTVVKSLVKKIVVPEFKRIKVFFEKEYLPKVKTSIGISESPNGKAFYQNRIHYYTTLNLTADEIHEIGLKEVARIRGEMETVIKSVNFKGSFLEFLEFLRKDPQFYAETPEELLKEARDICKRIDEQLPRFFNQLPRIPYGVAPVPAAIAPKYTAGRYLRSNDKTEPGYYWVNTYDLKSRPLYAIPALSLHESVPGHHLQISLNKELGDQFPKFRKELYISAYGEGWGLYSEFLGTEMGIYRTPYEVFGKLTYEMWRACRLVIDTGIHAKKWNREQAFQYMKNNTALSIHEVNTEIDRYISWPGQALSYKMGEIKIKELREKVEKKLGKDFNIREFHEVILEKGTVTLTILEERMKQKFGF